MHYIRTLSAPKAREQAKNQPSCSVAALGLRTIRRWRRSASSYFHAAVLARREDRKLAFYEEVLLFVSVPARSHHGSPDEIAVSPVFGRPPDAASSLKGTVKFEGTAPKPTRIDMSQDPLCAKAHSTPATTEEVVVGVTLDWKMWSSMCLTGSQPTPSRLRPSRSPSSKGLPIQAACSCDQASQKPEIVNSDETTHNIHPNPSNNREWNMTQPHGAPLEQTFAREEIAVPIKCNVHPWMKGYIAVFKHPYFSVTDKDEALTLRTCRPVPTRLLRGRRSSEPRLKR